MLKVLAAPIASKRWSIPQPRTKILISEFGLNTATTKLTNAQIIASGGNLAKKFETECRVL